jgi:hypothetical protein
MAKFVAIQWADMHGFCVASGLKLLNPPVQGERDGQLVINWGLLGEVPFVRPETVVANPAADLYKPIRTGEMVYGKRVWMQGSTRQLTLRVYTTIDPWAGEARKKGSDAIRVALFWREILTNEGGDEEAKPAKLIGGDTKCLRVEGWRGNLGDRLQNWPDLLGPECPRCQRPMAEREYQGSKFWGCTGYPVCKATINFGQETAPRCPKCSNVLVERKGSRGPFMGCRGYPACKYTCEIAA